MKALILQHVENEGPGTLGAYLADRGVEIRTRHLYRGDGLPSDPAGAGLIVSMGGPMNVYEDEEHPFLPEETDFLRRAIHAGAPVLGICLGAQLIARAAGAGVYRAPAGETGWGAVSLTEAGALDPVVGALPEEFPVLQWHEDTFDIPAGGELLAESAVCRNQAFRLRKAWGLQFHVEVERAMLAEWFGGREEEGEILRRYDELAVEFDAAAERFYEALLLQAEGAA